jgi:hypothetical protein
MIRVPAAVERNIKSVAENKGRGKNEAPWFFIELRERNCPGENF